MEHCWDCKYYFLSKSSVRGERATDYSVLYLHKVIKTPHSTTLAFYFICLYVSIQWTITLGLSIKNVSMMR